MVNFLSTLAVATCGLAAAGVHAQADQPTCSAIDYTQKASDFSSLNQVIDIAVSSGLLAGGLAAVDPLVVKDQRLDVVPFRLLGMDFTITPVIKDLNVLGLSKLVPGHLNVTGPSNLGWGVDFDGLISVDGTFAVEIQQLDRKWYQICWTAPLDSSCPPLNTAVDVAVAIVAPSVDVGFAVPMLACPEGVGADKCKDLTVGDILLAALSNDFEAILARILLRVQSFNVTDLAVDFEKIEELSFKFEKSSNLLDAIAMRLISFTADEINKKKFAYKTATGIIDLLAKSLVNDVVSKELAPKFGNNCYDP